MSASDDDGWNDCGTVSDGDDDDGDWSGMAEANEDEDEDDEMKHSERQASPDKPNTTPRNSVVQTGQIPMELKQRVSRDMEENFGGETRIALRVGFPVKVLGLNQEQARAWGLSNALNLLVELHFPPHYFSVNPNEIRVSVGQAAANETGAPTDLSPLPKCHISWILEQRVRSEFLPRLEDKLPIPEFNLSAAKEVANTCDCTFLAAVNALITCKGDKHAAVLHVTDIDRADADAPETDMQGGSNKSLLQKASQMFGLSKKKKETVTSSITTRSQASASTTSSSKSSDAVKTSGRAASHSGRQKKKQKTKKQKSAAMDATTTVTSDGRGRSPSPTEDEQKIMSVHGVSLFVARRAAALTENDTDQAIALLLDDEEREALEEEEEQRQAETRMVDLSSAADTDDLPQIIPSLNSASSRSLSFSPTFSSAEDEEVALIALFSKHNFLVRLLSFVQEKIHSIHSTCYLCETPLPYPGLNLSICSRPLCQMSYNSLGVGFQLTSQIVSSPLVIDLYISMLFAAAHANHLPFVSPTSVTVTDKEGKEHDFLSQSQTSLKLLDCSKLLRTLNKLPSIEQMTAWIQANSFTEQMNKLDILLIPLLRWLFQSNPTYLRELNESERFSSVPTPHQFVMLMSSPEREHEFQQLKQKALSKHGVGSIWSWHGSRSQNWHSIMRTNLKNMSNTVYMSSGAAYGAGVYMAAESGTSLGYSQGYHSSSCSGWSKSMMGSQPTLLALCEVVNDVNGSAPSFNPYLVIPQENLITTRYLFVFNTLPSQSIQAASLAKEMNKELAAFSPIKIHHK